MLLASTIPSPTLYIARNNGFAISTPVTEQFYGDGIASRGPGYGIDTVRVDGNDVLAVLACVRGARQRCLEGGRAVLVEAMTYRHVVYLSELISAHISFIGLATTQHPMTPLPIAHDPKLKTENLTVPSHDSVPSSNPEVGGMTRRMKSLGRG
jgi:hypothetical protein